MSDRWPGYSEKSSGDSTPVCFWDSPLPEDEVPFKYETPFSSVCSDELINPAILPAVAVPGLGAIEVVDLTDVDEISAKHSDVGMIQDDSAPVRGVEAVFLAVGADVQQGQKLAPKISAEIELTVVDD
ncbi:hypothetical protein EPUS_07881 [Endocarpon pusillum Z07020]|uniref:Uncharacterized protein n=1 Tax=Endocarpon pusillum (strain Z07020 / HMAS-L-300199) TaxID=1263415 RepID=U1HNI3_ENDPU|nr:uncharacterized protein EPUS_07881 [Endocarpon pusillum Z07020]ERF70584.1 hypothetical protein EPUS_07881 [Endocarpon pusillum Z07020]